VPHGDIGVSAGFYVVMAVWGLILLASLVVAMDSLTGRRRAKVAAHAELVGTTKEPTWLYAIPSMMLLLVVILFFTPLASMTLSVVVAVVILINLASIPLYLLRMVFPTAPDCEPVGADSADEALPVTDSPLDEGA